MICPWNSGITIMYFDSGILYNSKCIWFRVLNTSKWLQFFQCQVVWKIIALNLNFLWLIIYTMPPRQENGEVKKHCWCFGYRESPLNSVYWYGVFFFCCCCCCCFLSGRTKITESIKYYTLNLPLLLISFCYRNVILKVSHKNPQNQMHKS